MQKFIDEAPDGAILFSLGTNVRAAGMCERRRTAFLKAFSKLKQRVLWKWEVDTMPDLPSNVKIWKWLPQSDILGKSTRLL